MSDILVVVMKVKYDKIKILRVDNDKTQQELADFLNLTRSAYSNYENNIREIPIEVLSGIADFWNTSVDYLLDRTDEKKPYPRKEK